MIEVSTLSKFLKEQFMHSKCKERNGNNKSTYKWKLKSDTNEHIYKQTQIHRYRQETCGCQGRVRRWKDWELDLADANYCI